MSAGDAAPTHARDEARALRIHASRMVTSLFAGEYRSVFRGRGIEFEEVREYQDGDDVRAIDWNVTARAGRPFVKRYVEEREMTVMLLLDLSPSLWLAEPRAARRELVLRTCALLAYAAARSQDRVGLLAFSDRVECLLPPAKGMRHAHRLLAELVHLCPAGTGTDVAGALDHLCRVQKRRAIVFLLSDFLATDYRLALAATAARHDVVAILPQTELDRHLPAGGLVRMRDAEQGIERLLDSDCARVREAYRYRAEQRRAALRRALTDGGVELLEVTTWEPPARVLARFFDARRRRIAA